MGIKSVSPKTPYIDKLENIPGYTQCTKIPDVVKEELKNLNVITIHDFIMQVGTNKIKVPGLSKARYTNIIRVIVEFLIIVYGDGIIDRCIYNSEWSDWLNNYEIYHSIKYHMPIDRAIELLNIMIDHLSVAERNDNVIKKLLNIGFTEEELINEFNFCEDEVRDVLEELNNEE